STVAPPLSEPDLSIGATDRATDLEAANAKKKESEQQIESPPPEAKGQVAVAAGSVQIARLAPTREGAIQSLPPSSCRSHPDLQSSRVKERDQRRPGKPRNQGAEARRSQSRAG
ncbi:hypothetical protein HAX54_032606, partial [Datura stramonium]|nr:hypothetical protein [Datura stramonium]